MRSSETTGTYVSEVFPERLKALRAAIGATQTEMANKLGVSRAAIGYYENGERVPDIYFLERLVYLTGCNVHYLLGFAGQMREENVALGMEADLSDDEVETITYLSRRRAFHYFINHIDIDRLFDTIEAVPPLATKKNFSEIRKFFAFKCSTIFNDMFNDISSNIACDKCDDVERVCKEALAIGKQVDDMIENFEREEEMISRNREKHLKQAEEEEEEEKDKDKFDLFLEKMTLREK